MVYARGFGLGPTHRAAERVNFLSIDRALVRCRRRAETPNDSPGLQLARSSMRLAALPMPRMHAPAVTGPHPCMIDPVIPMSAGRPTARDPHMTAADPIPISADPDVSGVGRGAGNFHTRRRRRDHDDSTGIVTLIGRHDTCGQCHCDDKAENSSCD
jgi:hypothetical protein